jgi:hypothetical protein
MRIFTLVALAALASVALVPQPASAHTVSSSGVVYADGGSLCVINDTRLTVDHATGELTPFAYTSFRVYGRFGCDTIDVKPPGHIAVRYDLQIWNGTAWQNCRSTGWVTNSVWDDHLSLSNSQGAAPCGRGWYRTQSTSLVWDGSAWQGGTRQTPQHPPVP